jgi:hypothetical protein
LRGISRECIVFLMKTTTNTVRGAALYSIHFAVDGNAVSKVIMAGNDHQDAVSRARSHIVSAGGDPSMPYEVIRIPSAREQREAADLADWMRERAASA